LNEKIFHMSVVDKTTVAGFFDPRIYKSQAGMEGAFTWGRERTGSPRPSEPRTALKRAPVDSPLHRRDCLAHPKKNPGSQPTKHPKTNA